MPRSMTEFLSALAAAAALALTGCQTASGAAENQRALDAIAGLREEQAKLLPEIAAVKGEIAALREERAAAGGADALETRKALDQINAQLSALNSNLNENMKKKTEPRRETVQVSADNRRLSDGKLMLGEVEWIYVSEAGTSLEARIDTGASVSSISAVDIEKFERDGKTWYRFGIPADETDTIPVEARWVRNISVRQASTNGVLESRPVVRLTVKIADYTGKAEFSLKDRTAMVYPLLVGREFIRDIAVVDVSRKNIQRRIDADSVSAGKSDKIKKSKDKKKEEIPAAPAKLASSVKAKTKK